MKNSRKQTVQIDPLPNLVFDNQSKAIRYRYGLGLEVIRATGRMTSQEAQAMFKINPTDEAPPSWITDEVFDSLKFAQAFTGEQVDFLCDAASRGRLPVSVDDLISMGSRIADQGDRENFVRLMVEQGWTRQRIDQEFYQRTSKAGKRAELEGCRDFDADEGEDDETDEDDDGLFDDEDDEDDDKIKDGYVVTSSGARLSDLWKVRHILHDYHCSLRLVANYDGTLELYEREDGDVYWPTAIHRTLLPASFDEVYNCNPDIDLVEEAHAKYGQEHLKRMFLEMAPYLETPLTVRAVGYSEGKVVEGAQWVVEPNATEVKLTRLDVVPA